MENQPAPSSLSPQDERIMAALSHVAIIVPMMGLIAPILIWVTQREKSRYVAFQSLQAAAFQLTLLAVWIGGFACYMLSFFAVFGGTFFMASSATPENNPAALGFFLVPFVVFFSILAIFFIMIIIGIVAAVMTFQGKDFHYPLIGRWVERYQQRA
jgi:uncharacterized Tic20 family protein